ncbi:hypothetical protein QYE76_002991 [Lolium multiflorum]|uniref:TF-B3 domain-containing protein n=1 Tax=Lolium multiflorum TaxID=4521 RepID=A0AAD8RRS4_LOLMU|nr:hypothetical protein QYE76_002991 [Lolium multiflorum]
MVASEAIEAAALGAPGAVAGAGAAVVEQLRHHGHRRLRPPHLCRMTAASSSSSASKMIHSASSGSRTSSSSSSMASSRRICSYGGGSCNFCQWPVEVLFDGQGKMYLHTGWDKFACDLELEHGCQFTFLYEGDGEMIVKVFDNTACRKHYHTGESGSDTDS